MVLMEDRMKDKTKSKTSRAKNSSLNDAKDSPLARGENIANAFTYPGAPYDEEFSQEENIANKLKRKYQENLRQNYNVEFSEDEEIK